MRVLARMGCCRNIPYVWRVVYLMLPVGTCRGVRLEMLAHSRCCCSSWHGNPTKAGISGRLSSAKELATALQLSFGRVDGSRSMHPYSAVTRIGGGWGGGLGAASVYVI